MVTALIIIFVVAYAAIAFEYPLKINKSASALIGAGLLWTVYAMTSDDQYLISENLQESVAANSSNCLFFDRSNDYC